ncbi:hypothetical protein [Dictyobacter alpinus]|uniref:hypothetical protein n=1 Tax=Dictyobacter alpinus TaxID=2014873 RepID=UPI000F819BEC|nr:hypothetical protein [Dictyobacter alpinus]
MDNSAAEKPFPIKLFAAIASISSFLVGILSMLAPFVLHQQNFFTLFMILIFGPSFILLGLIMLVLSVLFRKREQRDKAMVQLENVRR